MSHIQIAPGIVSFHIYNAAHTNQAHLNFQEMVDALNTHSNVEQHLSQRSACATSGHLCNFGNSGIVALLGNPVLDGSSDIQDTQLSNRAEVIVQAYSQYGIDFVNHLSGDFSFILIDGDNDLYITAVDRLARYPIFWTKTEKTIIAASTVNAINVHQDISASLCNQGLYNYVYFHMVPSPGSIYTGAQKLLAGQALIMKGEDLSIINYWQPKFQANIGITFSQASTQLKTILKSAVKKQLGDNIKTGAFLSGGLDSSTVVGMLAEVSENEAQAFAIGFSAEGYDEMAYARITAKHFGVKLNEYYVTPEDVVDALPKIAASYDEPFGNSSALPAFFCAQFARENGIEKLLAGDGGDELFAGNERYVKQGIFERYHDLPKFVRQDIIEPVIRQLPKSSALFTKAKSYIQQANTPLPDRLQSYNFLHRHLKEELFTETFLSDIDSNIPLKLQREIFQRPLNASSLDRMLYMDWQYTLADNDLRKVSQMCALANVDVRYPMLDDQLLEFSCSIPDHWKIEKKKLRHFYKESLRGWLPDETINKKKQGFGLPFGVWMETHKPLRELAYDNLNNLKKRNLLKESFIDELIDMHQSVHAAYYGELVWVLTVLELWLCQHDIKNQVTRDQVR